MSYCTKCKREVSPPAEACPYCGVTGAAELAERIERDKQRCPHCSAGLVYDFQRNIDDPQMKPCSMCKGTGRVLKEL
jgi:hypothetical protein